MEENPMLTLTLIDTSTVSGQLTRSLTVPDEPLTARRLLRRRIYEEVTEYNANATGVFQGLVQPTETEQTLNGFNVKIGRHLDSESQYRLACTGFAQRSFIILVNDQQITDLDAPLAVTTGTAVEFFKLVPIVGG
jgi:hypothetical protein